MEDLQTLLHDLHENLGDRETATRLNELKTDPDIVEPILQIFAETGDTNFRVFCSSVLKMCLTVTFDTLRDNPENYNTLRSQIIFIFKHLTSKYELENFANGVGIVLRDHGDQWDELHNLIFDQFDNFPVRSIILITYALCNQFLDVNPFLWRNPQKYS